MIGSSTPSAARFLGFTGAFLLISASAAIGAYYGFTIGAHHHLALGVIFSAAALGGDILKPLAIAGAVDALRSREFLRGLACLALGCVCIVYSLASELGLAAGSRGDLASARQLSADVIIGARDRRARAAAELASLPPARLAAELNPLISKLKVTPGAHSCIAEPDGPISRRICGEVLTLQAEAARAARRSTLDAVIAKADTALANRERRPASGVGAADPLASVLSAYVSAFGQRIEPDTLSPWLSLVPVLFLEFGSALSLIVVRSIGATSPAAPINGTRQRGLASTGSGRPEPATSAQSETEPSAGADASEAAADCEPDTPSLAKPDTVRKPRRTPRNDDRGGPRGGRRLGNVVDLIKARGGKIEVGQRGLAKALGVSKSRVNELLHELARSGRVRLATGPSGSVIELSTA